MQPYPGHKPYHPSGSQPNPSPSVHESIGRAWNFLVENWKETSVVLGPIGLIFGGFLYYQIAAVQKMFSSEEAMHPDSLKGLESASNLSSLFSLLIYFLIAGMVRYYNFKNEGKSIDRNQIPWKEFFHLRDILLVITVIMWSIAGFIGIFLFIIPGIYVMNLIYMGMIHAIESDSYFLDSIKETFRITKGHWWKLAYLQFLLGLPMLILMGLSFGYLVWRGIQTGDFPTIHPVAPFVISLVAYTGIFPLYIFSLTELHKRMTEVALNSH